MNVVSLDSARAKARARQPVQPPAALGSFVRSPSPGDDLEDRVRMRQNLAAIAVIAAVVVLGIWLIDGLRAYSRLQACIEAGHRNCVPIDPKHQPSPYTR